MNIDLTHLKKITAQAFLLAQRAEVSPPIDLARLGAFLREVEADFSAQKYGAERLRPCLEKIPDVVQLIKDDSIDPPRFFATYVSTIEGQALGTEQHDGQDASKVRTRPTASGRYSKPSPARLDEFAWIHSEKWLDLAELALPENWGNPKSVPLLINYVRHTYSRLVREEKIMVSEEYATFNTGLVDRRFKPIYILLKKHDRTDRQPWRLDGFCIAGENYWGNDVPPYLSST